MRRRLADAPPENLADASRMAAELAQMMSEGVAVDGTDSKLARALAEGLADLRREEMDRRGHMLACQEPATERGFCRLHAPLTRRTGEPLVPEEWR